MAIYRHPSSAQPEVSAASGQCLGCLCCTTGHGAYVPDSVNLFKLVEVQVLLLVTKLYRCGHTVGRGKLPVSQVSWEVTRSCLSRADVQQHLLGTYMSHKAFICLVKEKMLFQTLWE